MIGTVGLDDGEIGHDVLGVDRVGLRVLVEEVDLALCIRDLELDPGVDPCGVEHPVVKPDQVVVLFLAAVTAVREVSSGDVGSIASKTAAIRAVEAVELKQVIQKPKSLVDGITKLVVGEGGFFAVRCDGNDVVCPYVLTGWQPKPEASRPQGDHERSGRTAGTLAAASQPCSSCSGSRGCGGYQVE